MPQSHLRFGVARENRKRSTTWKVWTRRRDIYVASRVIGKCSKISLHESGKCHFAFDPNYVDKFAPPESPLHENRFSMKWDRPPDIIPGLYHALTIVVPYFVVTKDGIENEPQDVIWIPAPDDGRAVEIAVLVQAGEIDYADWPGKSSMGTRLVGELRCDFGRLWVVYRHIDPPNFNVGGVDEERSTRFTQHSGPIGADDRLGVIGWGMSKAGFPFMVEGSAEYRRREG